MPFLGHGTRHTFRLRSPVTRGSIFIGSVATGGLIAVALSGVQPLAGQTRQEPAPAAFQGPQTVLDKYCITCHNQRLRTAGLALDSLDVTNPGANAEVWEKVIAKLRAGSMPPAGRARPDAATYHAVASSLETDIDRAWTTSPNRRGKRPPTPGPTC